MGAKINKDGFGIVPKMVMQDSNIHIASKAVYAYFCSFAGAGDTCFPTRKKICFDLSISNDSLSKYLKQLVDNGYLLIEQVKQNGRFSHNVYTLTDAKLPCPKISDTEETGRDKSDAKNNNVKNNNLSKINSEKKERKKETAKTTYDSILSNILDEELRELYLEYIKMRKLIKAPMTDRALTILISKVNQLEPDDIGRQKKLLETSIANNWKSVYPLKDEPKPQKSVGFDLDEFFNAACDRSEPKTAGNDEAIRERAERLRRELS